MNRIRSRLAPLAALMALLLALAGCSAAPSTEEPGTASQTKYATGKYTQTEVTPRWTAASLPPSYRCWTAFPRYRCIMTPKTPQRRFPGRGWLGNHRSLHRTSLSGRAGQNAGGNADRLLRRQRPVVVATAETGGALTLYRVDSQGSVRTVLTDTPPAGGPAPYITDFAAAPGYAVVCLADGAGSCVLQIVDGQSGDISATIRPSVVDYTFAVSGNRLYLRNRNAGTMDVYALPSGEKADSFAIVPEAQEVAAYAVDGENQQIVFLTMDGVFQADFGSSVKQAMVQEKALSTPHRRPPTMRFSRWGCRLPGVLPAERRAADCPDPVGRHPAHTGSAKPVYLGAGGQRCHPQRRRGLCQPVPGL
ncbi:hypothetical protein NIA69_23470 [Gemmiger formicilis]|nr:hypothetical protein [Gemmiger formicilis]